jgi:hypothetical protein
MSAQYEAYLSTKIKEVNPDLAIPKQGAIHDILIKSNTKLLEDLSIKADALSKKLDFSNLLDLADDDIDAVASRFLSTRNIGQKASGVVTLGLNQTVAVNIPIGIEFFSAEGRSYVTTSETNFNSLEVGQNFNPLTGLYEVRNIAIEAAEAGTEYNVLAGTISATDYLINNLVSVTNPFPIQNGRSTQTNTELISDIESSLSDSIFLSPASYSKLKTVFTELKDITIVGVGQEEMTRDVINPLDAQFAASNFKDINYKGKVLASNFYPNNESQAYTLTDSTDLTTEAVPTRFTTEFNQNQYNGLFFTDTVGLDNTASTSSALFETEINNQATGGLGVLDSGWYAGEVGDAMDLDVQTTAFTVENLNTEEAPEYWIALGRGVV